MKKTLLFCTDAWFYLLEIPPIVLFVLSIVYTGRVDGLFGLIPLMLVSFAFGVFIFLFFLRFISLSFAQIKCRGPFSSHDHAVINEGKKLILTLKSAGRIGVELYGNDGVPPVYGGLDKPIDIYLFRGKAVGGKRALARVLKYYGVKKEDLFSVFRDDSAYLEYECFTLESRVQEDIRVITLTFTETV